jgi:hypothetical protein
MSDDIPKTWLVLYRVVGCWKPYLCSGLMQGISQRCMFCLLKVINQQHLASDSLAASMGCMGMAASMGCMGMSGDRFKNKSHLIVGLVCLKMCFSIAIMITQKGTMMINRGIL